MERLSLRSNAAVAVALVALLAVVPADARRLAGEPRVIQPWSDALRKGDPGLGCKPADCGDVERCIDLPMGMRKCWTINCGPCAEPAAEEQALLVVDASKGDPEFGCTPEQCGTNQTKCITVPVKGDVCWNVTCPACPEEPKEELLAAAGADVDKKTKKDDKKKFGCLPEDCDTVKEVCMTVPVAGDICWNVTCPACNKTEPAKPEHPEEETLVLAGLGKKDSEFGCTPEQCGTNQTKCISVPVAGDICWNVTCPACPEPEGELLAAADAGVDKKKKKDDKKKFGCLPEDCDTVKEVCMTVPVAGDICWNVTCPACNKTEPEGELLAAAEELLAAVEKKGDKEKYYCTPEQCGTNQTKCIDVPFKGKVCWDVTCPPCKDPKADAMPCMADAAKKKKKDDKKKFGCLPEDCDTVKEVCITVPVAGDICWNVTCPACNKTEPVDPKEQVKEAIKATLADADSKSDEDKKKFGCLPEDCGTTKNVCMNVPVVGDICWDVDCPACPAPDSDAGVALL